MKLTLNAALRDHVRQALQEDLGEGDATSLALIPTVAEGRASIVARQELVLAGCEMAIEVFRQIDSKIRCEWGSSDGEAVSKGAVLFQVAGSLRGILSAERTVLNYLQRLSGIATVTAQYVEAVRGTQAVILDTRKTTPGWRVLEKYAVLCGGGRNHRMGLYDMIMIKDNHLAALRNSPLNPVAEAVRRSRQHYPNLKVEVEADRLDQAIAAVEAGADRILLDNMSPEELKAAVVAVGGRCETEASGGIHLGNVRQVALTGVDYISVGALTHSATAVDIALDLEAD